MRLTTISKFLLVGMLTVAGIDAQTPKDKTAERMTKMARRLDQFNKNPDVYTAWHEALSSQCAVCPVTNVGDKGILVLTKSLWEDDKIQRDVSDKLLKRLPLFPKAAYDDWIKALTKSTGESLIASSASRIYTLLVLIQQDQLFEGAALKEQASNTMLKRLQSVPKKFVGKWVEVIDPLKMETLSDAALSLIQQDAFFQNDIFQEEPFNRKLIEMTGNKT